MLDFLNEFRADYEINPDGYTRDDIAAVFSDSTAEDIRNYALRELIDINIAKRRNEAENAIQLKSAKRRFKAENSLW